MALNETDDLENEGVSRCLEGSDPEWFPKRPACDQNAYWKARLCRVLYDADMTRAQACMDDRTMIPRLVEVGAGGPL
jgi:hypothetical protein